jgi:hypothetical protein
VIFSPDLVEQLAAFTADEGGLVCVDPDPTGEIAAIRGVESDYAGLVCPDCQAETGWDYVHWMLFLAGHTDDSDADEDGT